MMYDIRESIIEGRGKREGFDGRLGKCYELSYKFATSNMDWDLVHGYITDRSGKTDRTIDHAWVERGNTVYDPVMDKEFDKRVYYGLFGVEVAERYKRDKVIDMALKKKTYGPWHRIDKSKIKFP